MNPHPYIIGSGYHTRHGARGDSLAWFYGLWEANTLKYADPFAIYVMASGDGMVPEATHPLVYWVPILGDLGHCGDLLSGRKPYHFPGAVADWMILAMIAYANECDLIYKEQDLLAFGPYVEAMYSQIGKHGFIFGRQQCMPCNNSLWLVKHSFIPELVRLYLDTPRENTPDQIGELKFVRLEREHPEAFCRYDFGVDRDRPLPYDTPVWCAQKFTPEELLQIREKGLIEFDQMPEGLPQFSNSP